MQRCSFESEVSNLRVEGNGPSIMGCPLSAPGAHTSSQLPPPTLCSTSLTAVFNVRTILSANGATSKVSTTACAKELLLCHLNRPVDRASFPRTRADYPPRAEARQWHGATAVGAHVRA
eukprot:4611039-Pleurochrysis_carterae.AAC.1